MRVTKMLAMALLATAATWAGAGRASAHCDRVNGPVATAAREALEKNDFSTVVIWVGPQQEQELRRGFEQSLPVYRQGGKAGDLASRYFMETAVRLHRAAEGFAYTGLKPAAPPAEDVAVAEKALATGDLAPVIAMLSEEIDAETRAWFEKARQAREHKDESVEAGRRWADAYVKYIIYVHGLHQRIQAGPSHGVGD